jgi:hypothetical protein
MHLKPLTPNPSPNGEGLKKLDFSLPFFSLGRRRGWEDEGRLFSVELTLKGVLYPRVQ